MKLGAGQMCKLMYYSSSIVAGTQRTTSSNCHCYYNCDHYHVAASNSHLFSLPTNKLAPVAITPFPPPYLHHCTSAPHSSPWSVSKWLWKHEVALWLERWTPCMPQLPQVPKDSQVLRRAVCTAPRFCTYRGNLKKWWDFWSAALWNLTVYSWYLRSSERESAPLMN